MSDFRKQIQEDIREYQENYPQIANIAKDEWAFNYWVLDKLFYEEDELIEEKILDYHDMGIDAYELYEDTKDVYLIQNKYYSDESSITAEYIKNDFLVRGITALENGTYKKCEELQGFFNKYKAYEEFTVHLELYITNNKRCEEAERYIRQYNLEHPKYRAKIYYLDDIEEKYFGEIKENKTNLSVKVQSINRGTILNINSQYKFENILDGKYVLTPVVSVYRMYRDALEKNYPIFDKNIREYLGNRGVNKKMYETLLDGDERKNFFYYNNGVTVICDSMGSLVTQASGNNMNVCFDIQNPQIVNGCQTVNTIYEALKNVDPAELEKEYKDTFVMLKILVIDKTDDTENELYKNIVRYNNSQNPIDEKTFVANTDVFVRLQKEFEEKGFLLLIKQSDKYRFAEKYKITTKLKQLNQARVHKFALPETKKANDVFIPLEKFLQVINAFVAGGHIAYGKKANMLKFNSEQYNAAIDFVKNNDVTIDAMLDLYLLYRKADQTKKKSDDKRSPIPYYLIDAFALYECENRNPGKISEALDTQDKINQLIDFYKKVTKAYYMKYFADYKIEYNKMIKRPVEYSMLDYCFKICEP